MNRTILVSAAGAVAATLWCSAAVLSAQAAHDSAPVDERLATSPGQEVSVSVSSYTYTEPGALSISIAGPKLGGDYTATGAIDKRRHWFLEANVRGTVGNVTYTGWCSPWLITPDSASPNGYALDEGDASPCSESGDRDWYLEGRAQVGKDFIGSAWAWSPHVGLGVRHLSNGTSGVSGYRTDDYLYLPLGVTARTEAGSHRMLSVTMEYDTLVHGWQKTRDSALGGGDVPATTTAPAFTIDGFTDTAFAQAGGWALRASAKYQVTRRLSVEPYYIHWSVSPSPVNDETVAFTVHNVTAQEQLGFYEPQNATNEFGARLGLHFK